MDGFVMPLNNYAEKSVAVGTFGYRGKGITRAFGVPMENQFTRSGFKVDAYYDNLNVYGAVSIGKDNVHDVVPHSVNASAFYVEADYMLFPWMMPTARFEKTNFSDGKRNVRQMIPSLVMSVRANVRVLVEGHFFNKVSPNGTARTGVNEGVVRIEFAF
jgi:hypothetical protein